MFIAYLVGAIFLALILWQVFKIFTGIRENVCEKCGAEGKVVWEQGENGKSVPVCGECLGGRK